MVTVPVPEVQHRIADVFLAHTPSGAEGASLVTCWCGERFDTFAHHAEHAAAAVVAAFNFASEHRTLPDGMGGISTNWKTGETTTHCRPCTRQSRWVTTWTNELWDAKTPALPE